MALIFAFCVRGLFFGISQTLFSRSKSLHDLHTRNMFLYKSVQLCHGIAHTNKRFVYALLEKIGGYEQYGEWSQAD